MLRFGDFELEPHVAFDQQQEDVREEVRVPERQCVGCARGLPEHDVVELGRDLGSMRGKTGATAHREQIDPVVQLRLFMDVQVAPTYGQVGEIGGEAEPPEPLRLDAHAPPPAVRTSKLRHHPRAPWPCSRSLREYLWMSR